MRDTERQPTSVDTGRHQSSPTPPPTSTRTGHAVVDVHRRAGTPVRLRSRDEFAGFFAGLDLLDPGTAFVTD
ncbi:SAM-dependent methyltransferase [Streptomyces seoulensis]|uniref:SAM-dependent methyltransferase n=1 Tax=Streptomyces seoulensis TaxID=73044 RepID=UPI001FCC86C3|nr:SAM-dependent methyltransferase [Streptomyces seoulensis]BDH05975.1 hypothetical protein HEK131_32020 [Streptomyces seoulensis]